MTGSWRQQKQFNEGFEASKRIQTQRWINEHQCKLFIWSCYLYEIGTPALHDTIFDSGVKTLIAIYDELPVWFKVRVPIEQLHAGTSVGLQISEREKQEALDWLERVKEINKEMGRKTPHDYFSTGEAN